MSKQPVMIHSHIVEEMIRLRDAENDRLKEALEAADSILWMAERYAESGGSRGPEMRDFLAANKVIQAALGRDAGYDEEGDNEGE